MPDITFLEPRPGQCILTTHVSALARANKGTGVVNGNQLTASSPASRVVHIAAGRIRVAGAPVDVEADTTTHDEGHATLPGVDVIYRDAAGDAVIAKGTPTVIVDPKQLGEWKSYTSPQPPADVPPGAILGAVYVPATATTVTTANIWMFAVGVEGVSTTVASPGSDAIQPTEKAVRTLVDTKIASADIITTVGATGSDTKIPSEQAVRELADTKIDTDDIVTSIGTPGSDTKVASEQAVREAFAALGNIQGVTNGDNHNHVGGDEAAITAAATSFAETARILARKAAGTGVGEECSLSDILDFVGSAAWGASLVRGETGWIKTAKGAAGQVPVQGTNVWAWAADPITALLTTRGQLLYRGISAPLALNKGVAGQRLVQGTDDPAWSTSGFAVAFPFGDGTSVLIASSCAYEIPIASKITAARIRSFDAAGAPVTGSVTCTLYKHAIDGAIGTLVDTFAIASANHMHETGLSIAVAAEEWLTVVISGILTCKQITCSLTMGPT